MKHVLSNATILSGEDFEVVKGYMVIDDKIIEEIGEGSYHGKSIDVKGGIIFPSFINSHTHVGDSLAPDIGAYATIDERVGKDGFKHRILEEKSAQVSGAINATLKEMLKGGCTAISDFREGGLEGIKQLKSAIPPHMDCVIMGRPGPDQLEEVLENCDGIGISSIEDYSEEDLKIVSTTVRRRSKILGVHVGEVVDDLERALSFKPDFMVHLTNVNVLGENLENINRAGIPVILCPRANAMLGVGIPRLKELFDSTLVALGTDNVMINSPDMFREMEFTFKIIRGMYKDHKFKADQILKAATLNGRKIFALPDNSIMEGNLADFIVAKKGDYITDPVLSLVHRTDKNDVRAVFKNGCWIVDRGI